MMPRISAGPSFFMVCPQGPVRERRKSLGVRAAIFHSTLSSARCRSAIHYGGEGAGEGMKETGGT